MLKFTRNSVIAFDFKDALSFEGETGPVHSVRRGAHSQHLPQRRNDAGSGAGGVRQASRKSASQRVAARVSGASAPRPHLGRYLTGEENEDIWALWLRAGRFSLVLEQCIAASEPAYLAKHAFQLAQEFTNFYHRHHILTEEDPARKTFLLATAAVALRELVGRSPCSASKARKRCEGSK